MIWEATGKRGNVCPPDHLQGFRDGDQEGRSGTFLRGAFALELGELDLGAQLDFGENLGETRVGKLLSLARPRKVGEPAQRRLRDHAEQNAPPHLVQEIKKLMAARQRLTTALALLVRNALERKKRLDRGDGCRARDGLRPLGLPAPALERAGECPAVGPRLALGLLRAGRGTRLDRPRDLHAPKIERAARTDKAHGSNAKAEPPATLPARRSPRRMRYVWL